MAFIIPNRNYRIVLVGSTISQIGDWASRLALSVLVYQSTGSPLLVGLLAAILVIPWLGPGQWLAAKGDNLNRKNLLIGCEVMRSAVFLLIGAFNPPVVALFALVLLAATIDPVFESNRSALITEIVSKAEYGQAIKLAHTVNQTSQLFGYAIGGGAIAIFNAQGTLLGNGISFMLSAISFILVRYTPPVKEIKASASASLSKAIQFLRSDKLSAYALILSIVTIVCANSVESQVAVYGEVVGGLNPSGVGILAAVVPLATLAGIIFIKADSSDSELLLEGTYLTIMAAALGTGVFFFEGIAAAYVGFGIIGTLFVFSTAANIVVGRRIPDEARASTFAVLQTSIFLAMSGGAVLGGGLVSVFGSRNAAIISTAIAFLTALSLRYLVGDKHFELDAAETSP